MKIVFNGVLEEKKSGCGACGKRVTSKYSFTNSKRYILPSGATKTFYVGKVEEVSERDGQFLLSYVFNDGQGIRSVFSKVE